MFISMYITLTFDAQNFKSIMYVMLPNSSQAIELRLLHCCVALNLTINTKKNSC